MIRLAISVIFLLIIIFFEDKIDQYQFKLQRIKKYRMIINVLKVLIIFGFFYWLLVYGGIDLIKYF